MSVILESLCQDWGQRQENARKLSDQAVHGAGRDPFSEKAEDEDQHPACPLASIHMLWHMCMKERKDRQTITLLPGRMVHACDHTPEAEDDWEFKVILDNLSKNEGGRKEKYCLPSHKCIRWFIWQM